MTEVSEDSAAPGPANDWQRRYAEKIRSAMAAVSKVRHGQRVFIGSNAGEPQTLVEALAAREDLLDTEIVHILTLGVAPYAEPKLGARFRTNAYFIGPNVRTAIAEGRADYTPVFLSEIPDLFRSGRVVIDVALIEVSPPDRHGYFSLGVTCDIVKAAAESARCVIAEVNDRMPRVLGDNFLHERDIDLMVPSSRPILEAAPPPENDVSHDIAQHIAMLIEDGSTLQLGIGSIPDAVLRHLDGRKNLGVHTEMFSDGIIDLVERGIINNSEKTLHRGKLVASFVMGTQRLYDFVDNNPLIEMHPTEYVNDPFIIARNDKMVAINAAIEIDFTGQVCADSLGTMFYSGIGGQVDFIRGAARSRGGKPIIALPATAQDGTISRIVPTLKLGAGVVTSRGDVHYVVTEYGSAYLHGRSIRERALALIQIAAPKFRPWLLAEAKARRIVYADQIELPVRMSEYPADLERWIKLRNDESVFLRPLKLTDETLLRSMFYRLSDETVHYRFFRMIKSMPHAKLQELLRVDYAAEMALVVLTSSDDRGEMVGIAHYSNDPRTNFAEAAFLVRDDYHGLGMGTALLNRLVDVAISNGVAGFTADVLMDNHGMLRVFHKCGYAVANELADGVYHLSIPFTKERKRSPDAKTKLLSNRGGALPSRTHPPGSS